MEGDLRRRIHYRNSWTFQSTPSVWRETIIIINRRSIRRFQSTPSVWRETIGIISANANTLHFNPLPPYGGRRLTPGRCPTEGNFNPLPPYGGRQHSSAQLDTARYISIHSLRMEGDRTFARFAASLDAFQSTPSVWRETSFVTNPFSLTKFQSTPSVWRETYCSFRTFGGTEHFNPLPPYGGRHQKEAMRSANGTFQSTPSVWRETTTQKNNMRHSFISIHSLRMEGDWE